MLEQQKAIKSAITRMEGVNLDDKIESEKLDE